MDGLQRLLSGRMDYRARSSVLYNPWWMWLDKTKYYHIHSTLSNVKLTSYNYQGIIWFGNECEYVIIISQSKLSYQAGSCLIQLGQIKPSQLLISKNLHPNAGKFSCYAIGSYTSAHLCCASIQQKCSFMWIRKLSMLHTSLKLTTNIPVVLINLTHVICLHAVYYTAKCDNAVALYRCPPSIIKPLLQYHVCYHKYKQSEWKYMYIQVGMYSCLSMRNFRGRRFHKLLKPS